MRVQTGSPQGRHGHALPQCPAVSARVQHRTMTQPPAAACLVRHRSPATICRRTRVHHSAHGVQRTGLATPPVPRDDMASVVRARTSTRKAARAAFLIDLHHALNSCHVAVPRRPQQQLCSGAAQHPPPLCLPARRAHGRGRRARCKPRARLRLRTNGRPGGRTVPAAVQQPAVEKREARVRFRTRLPGSRPSGCAGTR